MRNWVLTHMATTSWVVVDHGVVVCKFGRKPTSFNLIFLSARPCDYLFASNFASGQAGKRRSSRDAKHEYERPTPKSQSVCEIRCYESMSGHYVIASHLQIKLISILF